MEHICKLCFNNQDFHSFNHISKYDLNSFIFYTKITTVNDNEDENALIAHYENYLEFINPDKWIWVVNFNGFTLKHLMKINLTIKLGHLIQKYTNLEKIIIFNSNFIVSKLITTLKPFLGLSLFEKIEFYDDDKKNKFIKENNLACIHL
jgi:hypothetical protein